jgi:hypothetical protein
MKKISRLKRFLLAIVAALLILCLILFSGIFQVGSYPYAQEYKFDVPAEVLYDRVEKFKAHLFSGNEYLIWYCFLLEDICGFFCIGVASVYSFSHL